MSEFDELYESIAGGSLKEEVKTLFGGAAIYIPLPDKTDRILRLFKKGKTVREISRETGVSANTVYQKINGGKMSGQYTAFEDGEN